MDYGSYDCLLFERREHGVLLVTMNRPEKYNAADEAMHGQLARVWADIARDEQTRAVVVTGAGKAFSAGGDLAMVQRQIGDYGRVTSMLSEMSDLVYNMVNCPQPIVSAINGVAVGAGLVVALLADISICAAGRPARRRARPARRRGRRPRGDHLAAAVRHGPGPVLPAHRRDGHRHRGGADRPGQQGAAAGAGAGRGAPRGGGPGRRPAARDPADQAGAEQLAARPPGRSSTSPPPTRCSRSWARTSRRARRP